MEDASVSPRLTELGDDFDGNASAGPSAADGDPGLSSTFATAEIPADVLDHAEHSEDNLAKGENADLNYGYNSSSSSRHSGGDVFGDDLDDEVTHLQSAASSRSSISSIPGSVVVHAIDAAKTPTPSELQRDVDEYSTPDGNLPRKGDGSMRYLPHIRDREAAFRKPSSVRAMQMHTEDEDEEYLTPSRRRGAAHSQRNSPMSMRSIGSSPLRRSPYYSPNGSAHKQKVKKEYPLVLLHCSLLPPSLSLPAGVGVPNPQVLKEVLPARYWKRWTLLQEKVVGSGVLRDRGVLISHPQDAYDLLEERLLESLELVPPRLRNGHFLGQEESEAEKEDHKGDRESDVESEEGDECLDCGGKVVDHKDSGRKWELKVYAANGLMRAGAWAAAWKEMEKVDVEVGLWLPSKVRRELEKRILEEHTIGYEEELRVAEEDKRRKEVYGDLPQPSQEHIDGLDDAARFTAASFDAPQPEPSHQEHHVPVSPPYDPEIAREVELHTLLINYMRVLASDRRNVAIAVLSMLVAFFAFGARPADSQIMPFSPEIVEYMPRPAVSVAQYSPISQPSPTPEVAHGPIAQVKSAEPVASVVDQLSLTPSPSAAEEVASVIDHSGPAPDPAPSTAEKVASVIDYSSLAPSPSTAEPETASVKPAEELTVEVAVEQREAAT